MAYQFPSDIQQLIGEQMASGQFSSEDELLREALRALTEEAEDLAAVRAAVADWRSADDGVPLDDAFAELRKRHGVS